MARTIDRKTMIDLIIEAKRIDPEIGSFTEWLAEYLVERLPTLTLPNEALTLEQLRKMDGEPAWWDDGEGSCWGIISVDSAGMWGGIPFFRGRWRQVNFEYNIEERKMRIYRRPPEGGEEP